MKMFKINDPHTFILVKMFRIDNRPEVDRILKCDFHRHEHEMMIV